MSDFDVPSGNCAAVKTKLSLFRFCMIAVMILENEKLIYIARSLVLNNGLAVGSIAGVIGSSCILLG